MSKRASPGRSNAKHALAALFQPVYLGVRQDIPESECLLEQLE